MNDKEARELHRLLLKYIHTYDEDLQMPVADVLGDLEASGAGSTPESS